MAEIDASESGSVSGVVRGPHNDEAMVCQFVHKTHSQGGVWYGGNMFSFTLPVMMLQFILMFFTTSMIGYLLRPFKQGLISIQLIAGILLGSSFLGRIQNYSMRMFPPGGRLGLETLANFGYMFHLFILGVHIDISVVKKLRRNVVMIGIASFLVPFLIGFTTLLILPQVIHLEASVINSLPLVTSTISITTFPVITSLLADLKILSSEIGRIATSTSLVCDICNYAVSLFLRSMVLFLATLQWEQIMTVASFICFIMVVIFLVRPLIVQIAKGVTEGEQLKEGQFLAIMIIVVLCGAVAESLGHPTGFATFILGVVIPDGPPFGSSLVTKLDTFCTGMLLPAKLMISGLTLDIHTIKEDSGTILGLVILFSYSVKFLGTIVPALYYEIPFKDAVSLSLIMCCKGIIEVGLYITLLADGIINGEAYALLTISMLIVTGIARPLICWLYDPSLRYFSYGRNSIISSHPNEQLRVLVCIHNEDNVPAMIDLLRITNPTKFRPMIVIVVNLMELKGTANSLLEPSSKRSKLYSLKSWPRHVENAFNLFAQGIESGLLIRHFNSVAPYASMHDDICTLALDQETRVIIVPYHKNWTIDGGIGTVSPSIRMVNQNVLNKSPCSVGLLIDRGQAYGRHSILKGHFTTCRITMLFLGGPDDCEAIAYCNRLVDNKRIYLTLIRIYEYGYDTEDISNLELELVNEFKMKTMRNERMSYREEFVKDAIGTTRVIASMEECDLCIVGRYHDPDTALLYGLTDWNECPELGLIGDMLVTSDYKFSVLIFQQHRQGCVIDRQELRPVASGKSSSNRFQVHRFGTV